MERPRLKRSHDPAHVKNGKIRLGGQQVGIAYELDDPGGVVWRLLGLLDGSRSLVLLVLRLAWQAGLYTRTDLYLVVMDALRCRNLFNDTVAYLRFRIRTAARLIRGRPVRPWLTRSMRSPAASTGGSRHTRS
jgi:hypothetical protein